MVVLKKELVERFRRNEALAKMEFYRLVATNHITGKRMLLGEPVSLCAAKRVAKAMGVKVQSIIQSWVEIAC